jgi:hypothetical protein
MGLAVFVDKVNSFLDKSHHLSPYQAISTKTTTTSLFYTNDTEFIAANDLSTRGPLQIPVIGPLLNVPKPLIIGESMWLDPPTPLQWKTIEACVEAQQNGVHRQQKRQSEQTNNDKNLATIDQSPLVAILHRNGKDFATIAAIVGITKDSKASIDTSNPESFRESLASAHSPYYTDSGRVRFVGIGRAKLSRFTVQDDTNNIDDKDENGNFNEPLLTAQMKLILDSNENGKATSPVHALNQLSMLVSRIRFLHQDRQKIVRGLQAAQSRLVMASEDWQDWDGIGTLFDGKQQESIADVNQQEMSSTLGSFLQKFSQDRSVISSRPLSGNGVRCLQMDNYGLGSSPTAYADFDRMARELVDRLRPYYYPTTVNTEEFEYEAFSWVALESLKLYLSPEDILQALESSNTCERLEFLYDAMMCHKTDLVELAHAKSQELLDCGEECTDLF